MLQQQSVGQGITETELKIIQVLLQVNGDLPEEIQPKNRLMGAVKELAV